MAEHDEPLDDLRTAATVAATSAARVVDTVAREMAARSGEAARQAERRAAAELAQASRGRAPEHVPAPRSPQYIPAAERALPTSWRTPQFTDDVPAPENDAAKQRRADLESAGEWARQHAPESWRGFQLQHSNADTSHAQAFAEQSLIHEWRREQAKQQQPGYDSAEARGQRSAAMDRAGVPAEAKAAKVTADLMNGQDPAKAAAAGASPTVQNRPAVPRSRTVTPGR